MIEILPVRGIGEVLPGDDLATLIVDAAPWLREGDVLVVTSKIVSKAEGRLVEVPPPGPAQDQARADVIDAETARPVATRGDTRIVATHHGFVMASAGVDASNVDSSHLVLLPKDPDGSARALRAGIARRCGLRVAVVITDTMGRPWRNGLTDVALGAAGIPPLRDHRGETDAHGNELSLTQVAVVDELAAAAELVKGKRDQVPVAVVRGLHLPDRGDGPGVVAELVRDPAQDLFSLGTAEARAAGLREAAGLPEEPETRPGTGPLEEPGARPGTGEAAGPPGEPEPPEEGSTAVDPAAVQRAIATVRPSGAAMELVREPGAPIAVRCTATDPADPGSLVRLGADAHRLRAALAAEGIATRTRFTAPATLLVLPSP